MPSTHDEPIDIARKPNPERLWLFATVGDCVIAALNHTPLGIQENDPEAYRMAVGASVVRQLMNHGCLVHKDGEPVDLSRYDDQSDPPHTWSR